MYQPTTGKIALFQDEDEALEPELAGEKDPFDVTKPEDIVDGASLNETGHASYALIAITFAICSTMPRGPLLHFLSDQIYSEKTLVTSTTRVPENVCGLPSSSVWDILPFSYTTKVVLLGYTAESLEIGDLPIVPADMRSTTIYLNIRNAMKRIKLPGNWRPAVGSGWALLYRLMVVNSGMLVLEFVLAAVSAVLFYAPAFFLQRLVRFMKVAQPGDDGSWGWVYCAGLFGSNAITYLITGQLWSFSTTTLQARMRAQKNTLLFAKTLVRKDVASSAGSGTSSAGNTRPGTPTCPTGDSQAKDDEDKDEDNFHSKQQILGGIRMLKFMAWERNFEKRVMAVRDKELKYQKLNYIIEIRRMNGSTLFVTLVWFWHYAVWRGVPLRPSVAFSCPSVFNDSRFALNALPETFVNKLQSLVSARRVEKYVNVADVSRVPPLGEQDPVNSATISWPQERGGSASSSVSSTLGKKFVLLDMNLRFPVGELSVVCGKLGSGNTLLLQALLGEADVLTGQVLCPRSPPHFIASLGGAGANVAEDEWIVPGVSWLQNATIRENTLFHLPYNEVRYERTIEACALVADRKILEDGDQSEIGERGSTRILPTIGASGGGERASTPHDEQGGLSPTDLARAYSNAVLIERHATTMIKEKDRKLEAILKEIEHMQKTNCQGGVKVYSDLAVIGHEANTLIHGNNGMLEMLAEKGNDIQETLQAQVEFNSQIEQALCCASCNRLVQVPWSCDNCCRSYCQVCIVCTLTARSGTCNSCNKSFTRMPTHSRALAKIAEVVGRKLPRQRALEPTLRRDWVRTTFEEYLSRRGV
ncbi:hypothetical protein AURDEDRAFT_124546 [Auricularia subglabra TFB-10046 SS5]|nr:hypothetical protein AURDEDRAFT_124546 [Auricularia subglabra TFB-10046 SS5]